MKFTHFSKKLKKEREKRGWSQEVLANKLHVSRQSVSKWETGKNYPSIEMIISMSDLFEITTDELLKGEYVVSKVRFTLLIVTSFLVLVSVFYTDSISTLLGGIAGLIGIATWGYSSREVTQIVRDNLGLKV